jgi:hypothetical protein
VRVQVDRVAFAFKHFFGAWVDSFEQENSFMLHSAIMPQTDLAEHSQNFTMFGHTSMFVGFHG